MTYLTYLNVTLSERAHQTRSDNILHIWAKAKIRTMLYCMTNYIVDSEVHVHITFTRHLIIDNFIPCLLHQKFLKVKFEKL